MYTSVKTFPFHKFTYFYLNKRDILTSGLLGNLIVRTKWGWKTFQKMLTSFCTMSLYKKISSIYQNYTRVFKCCVSRKLVWKLTMKKHTYDGASLLSITVPKNCCLILLLNSKKLLFNINQAIVIKSCVETVFLYFFI